MTRDLRDRVDAMAEVIKLLIDEDRLDERHELSIFLALADQVRRRQHGARQTEWS